MAEPILTAADHEAYARYCRHAQAHGRLAMHWRRVDDAHRVIEEFMGASPDAYVAWSAGKDSTALALLAAEAGCGHAMSIKDDLDYPGEEEYLRRVEELIRADVLAGFGVEIVRPRESIQDWLSREWADGPADEDMHGRGAELSRRFFYGLIDAWGVRTGRNAVILGLRAEESRGRAANAWTHGAIYARKDGVRVCQPMIRWTGLDVFAFLLARGVDPFCVYRCCRLHGGDPSRVRKSWWFPGANTRQGGMTWLRTYWPSLYQRLGDMVPHARRFG